MKGGRRAGVTVTRDQIVDVAERIARRDGVAAVSVRRVAGELGVTAAALYWHVGSKGELLSELVDRASVRIERPGLEYGTWVERLVRFFLSTREQFTAYAGLSGLLMTLPPTAPTMDNCLYVIDVLGEAGFDEPAAIVLFDALSTMSWGHLTMVDMARFNAEQTRSDAIVEFADKMRVLLEQKPAYEVFVRSLAHFDDDRSRKQLVAGIEMLCHAAMAQVKR